MVYLFIGQDSLSKEIKLKSLRQELLAKETEQFNLDILYAKQLNLKGLQEKLLCLPVKAKSRIIVIKDAQELKEDLRKFILNYAKKPRLGIILVLDIDRYDPKDGFIKAITRHSKILRFKESLSVDTFTLSRTIDLKKADQSLRVLNRLLENGERPERILGGLRYACEKDVTHPSQAKRKRLRLLLNCDIDIKTGRLKPDFALEKLVVNLCCFSKSLG